VPASRNATTVRDDGRVDEIEVPGWVAAAIPAAVRLAAEAGSEVDEVLDRTMPGAVATGRLTQQVARLEQSAELDEVATDLAGLLWAECEDVPRIATIRGEPAAQAALEAVAEARRRAARRLAEGAVAPPSQPGSEPRPAAGASVTTGDDAARHQARPEPVATATPAVVVPSPGSSLGPAPLGAKGGRRSAGAMAARAAAAAIVVFGRRLRRA